MCANENFPCAGESGQGKMRDNTATCKRGDQEYIATVGLCLCVCVLATHIESLLWKPGLTFIY